MKKLILVSLIALSGCAGVAPYAPKTLKHRSVSYAIGERQARHTGEPMVVEEELVYYKTPVAKADFQIPPQMGSSYPAIRHGMEFSVYGRLGNGDTLYRGEGLKPKTSNGDPVAWEYCIAVDQAGEAYGDAACALGITRRWEPRPENFLEVKTVYKDGSSRKELLYGGRSGDTIRVSYREFRGSLSSQYFNQELTYDLSESSTIRFRSMVIDVLEANNNGIKFIVRSGMDAGVQEAPAARYGGY
ncbi:hypothetical protein BAC1_00018 [uncultured bacterium]|nr:hypothetical protein BAC1_00018 [uncultured bacterium]